MWWLKIIIIDKNIRYIIHIDKNINYVVFYNLLIPNTIKHFVSCYIHPNPAANEKHKIIIIM